MAITQQRVLELLDYDAQSGIVRWKSDRLSGEHKSVVVCVAGEEAGGLTFDGYKRIGLDFGQYLLHRIIWLYVHGSFPPSNCEIDHIDGNKSNNSINNLRIVSRSQNQQNLRQAKAHNRSSGFLGVHFDKQRGLWRAVVNVNKKRIDLGFYAQLEDAKVAREKGVEKYFTHSPINA